MMPFISIMELLVVLLYLAFGGDRLILVPTPLPASTNASTLTLSGMAHVGQDQFTKKCVTILCARALSVFVMDTYM